VAETGLHWTTIDITLGPGIEQTLIEYTVN